MAYPDEPPGAALRRMSVGVRAMTIEDTAPCVGGRVRDVAWPRECRVALVRRGRPALVPPDDVLLLGAEREARDVVQQLCREVG